MVEPGNPAALLEALRSLTSQPSLDEMGQRGQTYARERLSETMALDAYRGWVRRTTQPRCSALISPWAVIETLTDDPP